MFILAMTVSCKSPKGNGGLDMHIGYSINEKPLTCDTMVYHNAAGNTFLINEIQWFLSNMQLCDEQGRCVDLGDVFYLDTNIPESHFLHINSLPVGIYKKLRFTFGLCDADNTTGRFSNPPERDMFWPEPLGGGYHYMKLNGNFIDDEGILVPMNINLGRGQNADLNEFYDNSFSVEIPIDLKITESGDSHLTLTMNIDNWFCNPHVYDFNTYGSAIMQNQEAQNILKENGNDVFNATTSEPMKTISEIGQELFKTAAPKPHFMTWENFKNTLSNITKTNKRP